MWLSDSWTLALLRLFPLAGHPHVLFVIIRLMFIINRIPTVAASPIIVSRLIFVASDILSASNFCLDSIDFIEGSFFAILSSLFCVSSLKAIPSLVISLTMFCALVSGFVSRLTSLFVIFIKGVLSVHPSGISILLRPALSCLSS